MSRWISLTVFQDHKGKLYCGCLSIAFVNMLLLSPCTSLYNPHCVRIVGNVDILTSFPLHLHRLPEFIISDHDVIFTSIFQKELFWLYDTKLDLIKYRIQNWKVKSKWLIALSKYIYIFFLSRDKSKDANWISWPKFCYNTSFHTTLRTTPFKVVYGLDPPHILPYTAGSTKVDAIDQDLIHHDKALVLIRQKLFQVKWRRYMTKTIEISSLKLIL